MTALATHLNRLSDAALLRHAIARVSFPAKDLRSFSLHAPLELLSRYALLGHVATDSRAIVRLQLCAAAEHYERTTNPLPFRRAASFDPRVHDLALLLEQISCGETTPVAETTSGLVLGVSAERLVRGLAAATLDTLAAAGHAPIFFQRIRAVGDALAAEARSLLVALVPELARTPQLRFSWDPKPEASTVVATAGLEREVEARLGEVIADPPRPITSIFLLAHQTEMEGAPEHVLAPALQTDWSRREIADGLTRLACRIAARSMVVEPTTHAKLGWSHALTLAHANRVLLERGFDPRRCTRNALLFVLAFRHAAAERPLPTELDPPRVTGSFEEILAADPDIAASWAYHAPPEQEAALWTALATAAATRNDVHLVKHTLSALEMSRADPCGAATYRSAAAKLVAIWMAEQPTDSIRDTLDVRE